MQLPPVYIAFYWGTGLLSRIIEWFTDGPSHVALIHFDFEFNGMLQLGSEAGGWIYLPANINGAKTIYRLPNVNLWTGIQAQYSHIGCSYDIGGLLGMAWVMVAWRWLKHKVRNPLQNKSAWFCSEAVAQVFRDSGLTLTLAPGETDPGRLEKELINLGAVPVKPYEVI